jgi:hypothetical protein
MVGRHSVPHCAKTIDSKAVADHMVPFKGTGFVRPAMGNEYLDMGRDNSGTVTLLVTKAGQPFRL